MLTEVVVLPGSGVDVGLGTVVPGTERGHLTDPRTWSLLCVSVSPLLHLRPLSRPVFANFTKGGLKVGLACAPQAEGPGQVSVSACLLTAQVLHSC